MVITKLLKVEVDRKIYFNDEYNKDHWKQNGKNSLFFGIILVLLVGIPMLPSPLLLSSL